MPRPSVRTRVWRDGVLEAEDFPLEQFSDYLADDGCLVWADVLAPDQAAIEQIAEELGLDPHAVEDAMSQHERPKASRFATHLFVSAHALHHDTNTRELHLTHVSAFCLPHGMVTVRLDDRFDIDLVLARWSDNSDLVKFGVRALVYGLLDVIVDQYFDVIESMDDEIEDLEGALFEDATSASRQVQLQAFATRKSLLRIRRIVLPMREVVNTVMRLAVSPDGSGELAPYFEDLYDHVLRAGEWTESMRDMMSSILETNMALADTRLNVVMKKLTAWAAIVAVPTAITGWFGQNVPYPGFDTHWGVLVSLGLILAVGVALYVLFRRKDWL